MLNPFVKFPSLENTYRQKEIDKIVNMGIESNWLVTEKVHGANFSFWVEKVGNDLLINPAKRSGYIEQDEKFYNYQPVMDMYKSKLITLFTKLNAKETMVVFGELYGGNIQSGMSYSLDQDFIAFDIKVDGVAINKVYAFNNLEFVGIPTVPVIGLFSTFQEALDVQESFKSKLTRSDFDGCSSLTEAEGVVIEPVTPTFEANGSRIYLKKKTKRFLEKSGKPTIQHKQPTVLSENVKELLNECSLYINENRFNAVVSKIGDVSIRDIGKVMGLMTQDILEDFQKDVDKSIGDILTEKQDNATFKKQLMKLVQDFIKPILLKM